MELGVSSLIGPKKKLNSEKPIQLLVLPQELIVHASQNQSILEALIEANVEIDHSCGGMGSCGTCRVFVEKGLDQMGPRSELEQDISNDRNFSPEERLCCQNLVKPGLKIRLP